ncbi:MAG: efflux RND transporter periplasmic adaptor subunit [Chloroflexota bacterium]
MHLIRSILRNKKIILFSGLAAALALTLAFALPRAGAQAGYQTVALARGDLTVAISADGTARAHQSASLAWETTGVVESVEAQAGERVEAGETLAMLAQDSLPRGVALAEADLVAAQQALDDLLGSADTEKAKAAIALREAQEAYDDAVNYRELLDHEVKYDLLNFIQRPDGKVKVRGFSHVSYIPSEEQKAEADQDVELQRAKMEDAQRAYERLADGPNPQDVAAAEARILAAQAVLNQARIIAPFDGLVTEGLAQEGDRVASGQSAFQLHNLSSVSIDLDVSEVDINSIVVGQEAIVQFDAIQGQAYRGVVVEVAGSGQRSAGGVNFRVTVEVTDADGQVRPGMSAETVIQVRDVRDALLVPNRAIRMLDGQRVVYALREDGSLEAIPVRLGVTSDAYSELAAGGLQEGDQIVLNPPAVEK